jgi:Ca2+-binding RTX toxin-like protein
MSMGGRGLIAGAVVALALSAPASASATPTLAVENGAIRYVGDSGDNRLDVYNVENGEQSLYARDVTLGPGCRERPPDTGPTTGLQGNTLCTRTGVDRIEFVGGEGNDTFTTASTLAVDIPVHAAMGAGDDHFEFGSAGTDLVDLGPGHDGYIDGEGNDFVDGGPGNDDMFGGNFSTGDDVLSGGDGDDNLDGLAGNDTIDGGSGNDLLQPGEGDDTLIGGSGDDVIGGIVGGCFDDVGDDTMDGGPGNDQICGGPGADTLEGGDGNDALNTVDSKKDGPVACGNGVDSAWADATDSVATDCELQGDRSVVALPAPDVVPVNLPCAQGGCAGAVSLFATPGAARPDPAKPPPRSAPKAVGKVLAKANFKLPKHGKRSLRLKLSKDSAKRLRKLGKTTVEARTVFTQGGKRYSVRRTFVVKPKK